MSYRNEAYFPYVDTSASDEARRANKAANENRERLAGIEAEQTKYFANQGDAIESLRISVGSISRVIGDLEHRIEVLFKKDEKQTVNVQALQGQTSELASVVVDLAARLEESQEVQKEVIECLVQMKEALVAISEHVAQMEAGGREVAGIIEGILADEIDGGLQEGKEGEEESVGLPWQTIEFVKAVDVLCMKFKIYNEEAEETFDYTVSPPRIREEWREEFENSGIKEERQHFAEAFYGKITESEFRQFICEHAKGLVEGNRILYHENTKNNFNGFVQMACNAIIQKHQTEDEIHPA